MSYHILTDSDVERLLKMRDLVPIMEEIFREKASGILLTPPRYQISAPKGSLLVSAGGESDKKGGVIGIRLYDNFAGKWPQRDDIISVFDSQNGRFKGIVIGTLLSDMRTGAIGGVAVKYMSRSDSTNLAVIGTGNQAKTQLEAALAVRNFESIRIYSRSLENRKRFSSEMSKNLARNVMAVDSAQEAVREADVIICATVSTSAVIKSQWLKKSGVHINSVGPKFVNAHELDLDILPNCQTIATDSISQTDAYPKPFFLNGTPYKQKIIELHNIVAGNCKGRNSPEDNTLFISTGLAGTEIILAGRVLESNYHS